MQYYFSGFFFFFCTVTCTSRKFPLVTTNSTYLPARSPYYPCVEIVKRHFFLAISQHLMLYRNFYMQYHNYLLRYHKKFYAISHKVLCINSTVVFLLIFSFRSVAFYSFYIQTCILI